VLFDVSLEVEAGEVAVLLGRNGAGKSTTLKSVMGWCPSLRGSVRLDGRELAGCRPTGSAAPASATCPRTGASSPSSP
jgi:branched-chain amino acid transport system ATP-binding protein